MSMDWSDEPGRREIEKTRAAAALRKKPRKQPNGQQVPPKLDETTDYATLIRRSYAEIVQFKRSYPLRWRQLCNEHPDFSIPSWHESTTQPEEQKQPEQKPQQEEERKPQPPKQENCLDRLERMTLEEVMQAPKAFWEGVTRERCEGGKPQTKSIDEIQSRWERDRAAYGQNE